MDILRFREIPESIRTASDSYRAIRTSVNYPKFFGSVYRLLCVVMVSLSNLSDCNRRFSQYSYFLMTQFEFSRAFCSLTCEADRHLALHLCCLCLLILFIKAKTISFPHLNIALSQLQISYWRTWRKLVLEVRINKQKQELINSNQPVHQDGAFPGFCGAKLLEVSLLTPPRPPPPPPLPGRDASP